jgi:hypothetical protein
MWAARRGSAEPRATTPRQTAVQAFPRRAEGRTRAELFEFSRTPRIMDPLTGSALYNAVPTPEEPKLNFAEQLEVATELSFWPTFFLLAGTGTALSLAVYYLLQLDDLQGDRINPYTFSDRINRTLMYEFGAHAIAVLAVCSELHFVLSLLSLPALMLRALWWYKKKLVIDATTCYNERVQSGLKTRWGLMVGWHAIGALFGFVQVMLHGVLAVHRHEGLRAHFERMGEMHSRHGVHMHGMAGLGHQMMRGM